LICCSHKSRPKQKKKIATEFKINLKVLSATRKSEREIEENRITRLEAVVAFIREYEAVGSVDEPNKYIEDILTMRWGPWVTRGTESPLVYFGGSTKQTIVGLGGSAKHVIGNHGQSQASKPRELSWSGAPNLLAYLMKELGLIPQRSDGGLGYDVTPREYLVIVNQATARMIGPRQRLEFFAKRLLCGPNRRNNNVLLATPLYVALAE